MTDNNAPRGWAEIDVEQARRDEEARLHKLDQQRQAEEGRTLRQSLAETARRDSEDRRTRREALIDDLLGRSRSGE